MSDLVPKVMREVQTWIAPMLGRIKAAETVGEWQARKRAQAMRFMILDPSLALEDWAGFETSFVLVQSDGHPITIGRLKGALGPSDPGVDLTNKEITSALIHHNPFLEQFRD